MGGVWEKGFVIYTISNTMTKGHFVIHRIFCEVPQKMLITIKYRPFKFPVKLKTKYNNSL